MQCNDTKDATAAPEAGFAGGGQPTGPRFAIIFLATCLSLVVTSLLINYVGNADDLFPSTIHPALSDRAWKTRRLERMVSSETPPAVLILGSSRMMQIDPAYVEAVTRKKTYNYAVTGGNILDCLATYRYARRLGIRPLTILMNVDEEMLLEGSSLANTRLAGHAGLFGELPSDEQRKLALQVLRGLDWGTTARSLGRLWRNDVQDNGKTLQQSKFIFLENGYRINPARVFAKTSGSFDLSREIEADVTGVDALRRRGLRFDQVRAFSPKRLEYLQELMSSAHDDRITMYVVITPIHPSATESEVGDTRKRFLAPLQAHLQSECRTYGCIYRDFSDMASFAGDPNEFWDSLHQTPVNMRRMTNALFGLDPKRPVIDLPSEVEILRQLGICETAYPARL